MILQMTCLWVISFRWYVCTQDVCTQDMTRCLQTRCLQTRCLQTRCLQTRCLQTRCQYTRCQQTRCLQTKCTITFHIKYKRYICYNFLRIGPESLLGLCPIITQLTSSTQLDSPYVAKFYQALASYIDSSMNQIFQKGLRKSENLKNVKFQLFSFFFFFFFFFGSTFFQYSSITGSEGKEKMGFYLSFLLFSL